MTPAITPNDNIDVRDSYGRIIAVQEKTDMGEWRMAHHWSLEQNTDEENTNIFIGDKYRITIINFEPEEERNQEYYNRIFK